MKQFDTVIQNPTGLHARPAKIFVNTAKQFLAKIQVIHGDKKANAKSMISLLTLGVERGSQIKVIADGEDETVAIASLRRIIDEGLGESELIGTTGAKHASPTAQAELRIPATGHSPESSVHKNMIKGISGATGIAIGPIFNYKKATVAVNEQFTSETVEQELLSTAINNARLQIEILREGMLNDGAKAEAAIFDVHREFLEDAELLDLVNEKIISGHSAAVSWQSAVEHQTKLIANLADPILSERAADLRDVGYRVLCSLAGVPVEPVKFPKYPAIILAEDLTPSDTAILDRNLVLGFCTAGGGPTSHTAIIARALSLPAVVSAGKPALELANGTIAILDGASGTLTIDPSEVEIAEGKRQQAIEYQARQFARLNAFQAAKTMDGHRVEIAANIGAVADARAAIEQGAEGVGLLRTEFLFLGRAERPTEDEQFEVYKEIAQLMGANPVIIRTLDIGGDKPIPYIHLPKEENPFLGVRGIRLCMEQPELLSEQIRAVFRAAPNGDLRVMFPMVADLTEWRVARKLVEEIRVELNAPKIELGIMIEVPSAAIMADAFAAEVDFFSIGTNDLTQYTLAMDRMNPSLARGADGLHPAVLRLIQATTIAAHKAGKWVGICGELGADLKAIPILVGLGIDELSVSVPAIPLVKEKIRSLNFEESKELANKALACGTAQEVRELVCTSNN